MKNKNRGATALKRGFKPEYRVHQPDICFARCLQAARVNKHQPI